jgi:hypothetical protein
VCRNLTPYVIINLVLATCFTAEGIKTFREYVDQTNFDDDEDDYSIHNPNFIARVVLAPANSIVQEMQEIFIAQDMIRTSEVCAKATEVKNRMLTIIRHDVICDILKVLTKYSRKTACNTTYQQVLISAVNKHRKSFKSDPHIIKRQIKIHGPIQAMIQTWPEMFVKAKTIVLESPKTMYPKKQSETVAASKTKSEKKKVCTNNLCM